MNIVIVNDFGHVNGGASKVALGSAKALAGVGHRVFLFTAVEPVDTDLKGVPGLINICMGQHEILTDPKRLRALVQGCWNTAARHRFEELLINLAPTETVVHIHLWAKAISSSVVRSAVQRSYPVVLTLHDFLAACPNGTLFNHRTQENCHLKPMSSRCLLTNCDARSYSHKLWRAARQTIQSQAGFIPDGISDFISISQVSEAILGPLLPAGSRVHRVPNFIGIDREPPVDVRHNEVFVYSGRLAREKGVLLWADCALRVPAKALFIGDGELRQVIQEKGIDAITGWLMPAAAATQLRCARALVFPSLWRETQGLVVAEAAAMGIPSIVPHSCAAREWVVDGVTGLWFQNGDPNDLVEKVRHLRDHPELAAKLGQNAYDQYWKAPATVDRHIKGLEVVYRSMLENSPAEAQQSSSVTRSQDG